METGFNILKLLLCLSLVVVVSCVQVPDPLLPSTRPGACDHSECPTYKLLEVGYGYEIRMYNAAVWMSTGPYPARSMAESAKSGFQRLFSYIQGDNNDKVKMNMTAPVLTKATPTQMQSAYTVLFYLPKKNQQKPPQANGLFVQPWKPTHVAVRQFSGYVSDDAAKKEAAALMESLKGSQWIWTIEESEGKSPAYWVAVYDPPFQTTATVNEILVPFIML